MPNRCLTATGRIPLRANGSRASKQRYRKNECSANSLRSGRHRTLALEQDAQGLEHGLCALVDGHISGIRHSVLSVQIDLGAVIAGVVLSLMERSLPLAQLYDFAQRESNIPRALASAGRSPA